MKAVLYMLDLLAAYLAKYRRLNRMTEDKQDWSLKYQDEGSRDICFCDAEDCKTKCRRNRTLPFFTSYRDYAIAEDIPIRFSVSDFQNRCIKYKRTK